MSDSRHKWNEGFGKPVAQKFGDRLRKLIDEQGTSFGRCFSPWSTPARFDEQAVIAGMERRSLHAVDPQPGNAAMQRIKHPTIRNKINLADPAQVRVWTRRLRISADALKSVIGKVGNSVTAVTKEIELQRVSHQPSPGPISVPTAEGELPTPV
jgi:hypothetical protein